MTESQRQEMACFNWSCGYCGTHIPEQHAPDCKGLTPEMVALRKAIGQPWPIDKSGAKSDA